MLWSSLCHFPLHCSPTHLGDSRFRQNAMGRSKSRCVTLMGLIPMFTWEVCQEQSHGPLSCEREHHSTPKLCTYHELQRKRSPRAFMSCSKFSPRTPVMMTSAAYAATRVHVVPRPSVEERQTLGSIRVLRPPIGTIRSLFTEEKPLVGANVVFGKGQKSGHASCSLPRPCHHRWHFVGESGASRSACGWWVVQVDHDEEVGPMHGMHGTLDAELEVQRAIKRAELTDVLCLLKMDCRPNHDSRAQRRNH